MNSKEIESILKNDTSFRGCYSFDNLPKLGKKFPQKIIINTGRRETQGEHWIALLLTSEECFYFDSFGLPIINLEISKFLSSKFRFVTYSEICIQHFLSNKCGQFCLLFLKTVNNKKSYNNFILSFDHKNLQRNDTSVQIYLKKYSI